MSYYNYIYSRPTVEMIGAKLLIVIILFAWAAQAQSIMQPLFDAEKGLESAIRDGDSDKALKDFFASDGVIFKPEPITISEYLKLQIPAIQGNWERQVDFADISANGLLGYTTGQWKFTPKTATNTEPNVGQFATVWRRGSDGSFKVILQIEINHQDLVIERQRGIFDVGRTHDKNDRGWSSADATMDFLRSSMSQKGLGGAFNKYAGDDVRLLIEGEPPVVGKKMVVSAMKKYLSVDFPKKIGLLETADMAYSWNACEYSNSGEGLEKGHCLYMWKLRDKKWWIVLAVFAKKQNIERPILKERVMKKPPA